MQPSARASSIKLLDDRPADAEPSSRRPHEHPLDLAHGVAQELEAADADRLAVDLGDVEPPSGLEHLVEHLGRMVRLGRDDDPELDPDSLGRPVAELTRERGRGCEVVGRLDPSKAYLARCHSATLARAYDQPMSKITDELKRVALFSDLNQRQLGHLGRLFRERRFAPGMSVLREGQMSGIGFFLISEGEATVTAGGKKIATFGPGDHFGELAMISERRTHRHRHGRDSGRLPGDPVLGLQGVRAQEPGRHVEAAPARGRGALNRPRLTLRSSATPSTRRNRRLP